MEGLRSSRRLWIVLLVVAAGITLWLYLSPPVPGGLSLLFDAGAFGVCVFLGLGLLSHFVLPVVTPAHHNQAFSLLLEYAAGQRLPIVFVKDGRLIVSEGELKRIGPGVILVDAVSAAVLERARPVRARAVGPGLNFLAPRERIVAAADLRPQTQQREMHVLTRDGIELIVALDVTFSITPGSTRAGSQPSPYPFDPDSTFRAIYTQALADDNLPVAWTDLPMRVVADSLRNLVAGTNLDELLKPTVPATAPLDDLAAKLAAQAKASPVLRQRGLTILGLEVVQVRLPAEVTRQRVNNWAAHWQRLTQEQAAAVTSSSMGKTIQKRIDLQTQIIGELKELMEGTSRPEERQALGRILTVALRQTTFDLPGSIVETGFMRPPEAPRA
jgi:regulator of protease activity HflC (stomatin/prohibitin superfamily)